MKALPPIQALQALEAVERLGTVHKAADALSITASAVSHRLRSLEGFLGAEVVAPRGRGLTLTPRGRAVVSDVRPVLEALTRALEPPKETVAGPLRIASPPGFASAWLCPRLEEFRAANREVALTLTVGADDAADIEILFDAPPTPDGAVILAQPEFFPVCAPALANVNGAIRKSDALTGRTLLHLFDERDWSAWADVAGVSLFVADPVGVFFEDANLLLAAAVAGQGVALGDAITCKRYLEDGALVRLFADTSRSERAYALRINRENAAAIAFADWVKGELIA